MMGAAGGCAAMIRLLNASQAAAQDAAIFTIASLIKWNMNGVQRSFARNQGEAVGCRVLMTQAGSDLTTHAVLPVGLRVIVVLASSAQLSRRL